MAVFKGQKKVLAATDYCDSAFVWRADRPDQRLGDRPVHLHYILTGNKPCQNTYWESPPITMTAQPLF
jgi:hypothetical protein